MKLEVNGVRLYYEKKGKGSPLLLLHGNGESHKIFDRITDRLSEEYTVYAIDSRCHGQSSKLCRITYDLMAEDIIAFIHLLHLEKPVLYGFSDGGITGLLIAMKAPGLLSSLLVSGANIFPEGLEDKELKSMKRIYFFTRQKLYGLMIKEPQIKPEELEKIEIPVHLFAGEYDVIKREHTELIASHLKHGTLDIMEKENHSSYIVHNPDLYDLLKKYI